MKRNDFLKNAIALLLCSLLLLGTLLPASAAVSPSGDLDGNGKLTVSDVVALRQLIVNGVPSELPSVFDLNQADKDSLIQFENTGFNPYFLTYLVYQNPNTKYEIESIRVNSVTVDSVAAEFRQANGNSTFNGKYSEDTFPHYYPGYDSYGELLKAYQEGFCSFDRSKETAVFTIQCPDRVREKAVCVREGSSCGDGSCAVGGVIELSITLSGYSGELPYTCRFSGWTLCSGYGGSTVPFNAYK